MPFALLFFGVLFLVAGVRNKASDLGTLLAGEFTGKGNYLYWLLSIVVIGSVGYITKLKPVSDGFLLLVVLVLFLHDGQATGSNGGGFFQKFTDAINSSAAGASEQQQGVKKQ